MINLIDFKIYYWDRLYDYFTELRVDARWVLRKYDNDKTYGSLRIVSHPDLPPGYLRSIFRFVTEIIDRNDYDTIMLMEDFHMSIEELEVYSIDKDFKTELITYEAPLKELEDIFNVKVFE